MTASLSTSSARPGGKPGLGGARASRRGGAAQLALGARGRRNPVRAPALAAAQGAGVEVPLDFYKLLGRASHVASATTLTRSYDKALSEPPDVGYSQQTLLARGSILKGALETLLDPSARRDYDERLLVGDVVEDVPPEFVTGVLALLQEAGESQATVSAGERWLEAYRRDKRAGDAALAVALARCDLARDALEGQGDVVQAMAHMEAALGLLRQHRPAGASAALIAEVEGAVREMQPQLALALLALPLDDPSAPPQRARGLQVAEAVLHAAPRGALPGAGAHSREEWLRQLVACLTAAEQVRLYEACGPAFAESPAQLYDVAIACIAEGARTLSPPQLQRAASLLLLPAPVPPEVPEAQREKRAAEDRSRRAVALAVCRLLLGDSAGAEAALGLAPAGAAAAGEEGPAAAAPQQQQQPKCDRAVLQFIKANSPDREDLLPGICVLAQRWVHDVAFASFRQAHDVPFSLDHWFAASAVVKALKTLERGGSLEDGSSSALGMLLNRSGAALAAPFVGVLAAALSLVGLLEEGASAGPSAPAGAAGAAGTGATPAAATTAAVHAEDDMSIVDMRRSRQARQEAWAEQQAAAASAPPPPPPAPRAPSPNGGSASMGASPNGSSSSSNGTSAAVLEEVAQPVLAAAAAANGAAGSRPAGGGGSGRPAARRRAAAPAASLAPVDAASAMLAEFASQPVPRPPPLAGEEWVAEAYQTTYVRWWRILGTAAAVAAAALLGARVVAQRRAAAAPPAAAVVVSGPAAGGRAAAAAAEAALSAKEAAGVIKSWQKVKSEALGPQHSVAKLERVLTGPALEQWRQQAGSVQGKGWHYVHTLEGCSVDWVAPGSSPGTVTVRATLAESMELHKGQGLEAQPFPRSEYSVTYDLIKEGKVWKISAAHVH